VDVTDVVIGIENGTREIAGTFATPHDPRALIVFAHGTGSSRFSPRNRFVASQLNASGFATLLADLLTAEEDATDRETFALRFDVELLGARLLGAARWASAQLVDRRLPIGYFGASTGAAAAIIAAAEWPDPVFAVVSRGGRPDLAGDSLTHVKAPTLLVVGGSDPIVVDLNRHAAQKMRNEVRLEIVARATHLFEESGALERVADLARSWFATHLPSPHDARRSHTTQAGTQM
jgi:putative phosphoribosyl transferase